MEAKITTGQYLTLRRVFTGWGHRETCQSTENGLSLDLGAVCVDEYIKIHQPSHFSDEYLTLCKEKGSTHILKSTKGKHRWGTFM